VINLTTPPASSPTTLFWATTQIATLSGIETPVAAKARQLFA
jgi:hypothetical protein